jgi:hypothetical protein
MLLRVVRSRRNGRLIVGVQMKSFILVLLSIVASSALAGQANSISCSATNPQAGVQALYISDNFQSIAIISGISYLAPDDISVNLQWNSGTMSYDDGNGTQLKLSGLPQDLTSGFNGSCTSTGETFNAIFNGNSGNFSANQVPVTCQYSHDVSAGTNCQ